MSIGICVLLCAVAIFFTTLSQKQIVSVVDHGKNESTNEYLRWHKGLYVSSFIILASLLFFTKSGTDIPTYAIYYEYWRWEDVFSLQFEPGYVLVCVLLHSIIPEPYIGLGIIKVVTLYMAFRAFYLIRDKLNIGLSVLSYVILLFMFNFHLLRIMIAISLTMLAISYEVNNRSKKSFVLLSIAFCFHYTSLLFTGVFLLYKLLVKRISLFRIISISVILCIIYIRTNSILASIISPDSIFSKYTPYLNANSSSGTGLVQIVLFIPVLIILFSRYKYEKKNSKFALVFLIGIMTLFTGSLGYVLPTTSRSVYYFYSFFTMYIPSITLKNDGDGIKVRDNHYINISIIMLYVYLIMQVYIMYFLGQQLKSNGLIEYVYFWE